MFFQLLTPVIHDFKVVVEVGIFGHWDTQNSHVFEQILAEVAGVYVMGLKVVLYKAKRSPD